MSLAVGTCKNNCSWWRLLQQSHDKTTSTRYQAGGVGGMAQGWKEVPSSLALFDRGQCDFPELLHHERCIVRKEPFFLFFSESWLGIH